MTAQEIQHISDAFEKEHSRLLGWIRKRVPDSYDAEDILQDVFYQLTLGFRDLRAVGNITAWLYKVAGNKIIDRQRKKKPESFSSIQKASENDTLPVNLADILPAISGSPDENELREFVWEEIQNALKEMPREQAEVFILHEFEDKSFKEISEITGLGLNTLLSRKRYAVLTLRQKLKPLYNLIKS